MIELRDEQATALEARLVSNKHERAVANATLEGQRVELQVASERKAAVEAELVEATEAAAKLAVELVSREEADRAAKVLAASHRERLISAQAATAELARVEAEYAANKPEEPSGEKTAEVATEAAASEEAAKEAVPEMAVSRAERMGRAIEAQLEEATSTEQERAFGVASVLAMLRAKIAAAEVAIRAKRAHLKDVSDALEAAAAVVAGTERTVGQSDARCAALDTQLVALREDLTSLQETLNAERAAAAETASKAASLRAENMALPATHEQAIAAVDAILKEQRDQCTALAVKRAPAALPAAGSVVVIEGEAGSDGNPRDFPSLLAATLDSAKVRLAHLDEARSSIIKEHEAEIQQLAAQATEASAATAGAAARGAAHRRSRAALERYGAAISAA